MNNQQVYVAISMADGSVAVMGLLTRGRGSALPSGAEWIFPGDPEWDEDGWWRREPTDANIFDEISRSAFAPNVLGYRLVNLSEIPIDRSYRNAWKDGGVGVGVVHDMTKAKEIHREKIRRARDGLLRQNDIDLLNAEVDKDNSKLDLAKAKRDDLRNATDWPAIDAATTIEELKAAIPPVMAGVVLD